MHRDSETLLNYHPHEWPPLLYDHVFIAEDVTLYERDYTNYK